jgi:predicted acyl esterase
MSLSPGEFDLTETAWISMSDGIRLAARIWIPRSALKEAVPAILEYIPYRRRDGARERDDQTYAYLATHGFACIRLDIRGSGDSEGVIEDEYLPQEQHDAVEHYMGGAHLTGNLEWGSTFFLVMARAPDPLIVGVTLALNEAGYRFGTGHRVRVAISTCYWPIVWPAPKPGRLSIVPGSRYRIHPADPSTARAEAEYELIRRHVRGWETTIRTRSAIGCTAEYYLLEADLEAFEGEERIFSRSWSERIPRDFT